MLVLVFVFLLLLLLALLLVEVVRIFSLWSCGSWGRNMGYDGHAFINLVLVLGYQSSRTLTHEKGTTGAGGKG